MTHPSSAARRSGGFAAVGVLGLVVVLVAPVAIMQNYNAHRVNQRIGSAETLLTVPEVAPAPEAAPRRIQTRAVRHAARPATPRAVTPRTVAGFVWPVGGPWAITSPFGPRGKDDFHHGLDIGCSIGEPIRAAYPGKVSFVGDAGAYGSTVVLDHGGTWMTLYAHLSAVTVTPGTFVEQRAVLGACGRTGRATGPHLHLEIRHRGYVWDPAQYLG